MELDNVRNSIGTVQTTKTLSTAKFCLTCLATDCKLYPLKQYSLEEAYQHLTGKLMLHNVNFVPQFCVECTQKLINCSKFRNKSLRSYNLLLELYEKNQVLTTEDIKTINRTTHQLTSNIAKTTCEPDHYDLYLVHNEQNLKNIKIEVQIVENAPITESTDETSKLTIILEPKKETLSDINSDDEFLNDDFDRLETQNDTDFLHSDKKDRQITNDEIKIDEFTTYVYDRIESDDTDNNRDFNRVSKSDNGNRKVKKYRTTTTKKCKVATKKEKFPPKPIKKPTKVNLRDLKHFTVTMLSHEEQLDEIQKRKETSNFKISPYKCMTCFKGFHSVTTYGTHMEKHTNKFGQFVCKVCGIYWKTKRRLKDHMTKVHIRRYSCNICSVVTSQKTSALAHERCHDGAKINCQHCIGQFRTQSAYLSHLRIQHPSDVVCTLCGFCFINERGLQMHINKKHRFDDLQNASGPLCETCNVRFASDTAYKQHLKVSPKHSEGSALQRNDPKKDKFTRHSNIRKQYYTKTKDTDTVECGQVNSNGSSCEEKFVPDDARSRQLKLSRQSSDIDSNGTRNDSQSMNTEKKSLTNIPDPEFAPVTCEQCGLQLMDMRDYAHHFRLEHPDKIRTKFPVITTPHMCDQCGRIFQSKFLLKQHMLVHASQKRFKCDHCDKSFARKAVIENHMWVHFGEKPHKCEHCAKSFARKPNLLAHLRVHSSNRPTYECPLCGKHFAFLNNRRRHMFLHTGLKPFNCNMCGKCFPTSGEHRAHVDHVHLNKPRPKRVRQSRRRDPQVPTATCEDWY
ncbi:zinc finger protein 665 [Bicyclus anynana]|uniref:Zinc finger protein 665 n=1 Tax=Bicyclus anynana TaxID=110368 RepID=A0ABM3M7H4_BICAN|nr:zinc finger protein 665 [Bicyclus anynana]XP_052747373.1 zinc finger protein 665 [Bicyclus anynana]